MLIFFNEFLPLADQHFRFVPDPDHFIYLRLDERLPGPHRVVNDGGQFSINRNKVFLTLEKQGGRNHQGVRKFPAIVKTKFIQIEDEGFLRGRESHGAEFGDCLWIPRKSIRMHTSADPRLAV